MGKRANGTGMKPRQRADGRWECRYVDADGRRRSVYAKTEDEATAKMVAAMAGKDEQPRATAPSMTVSEFLSEYMDVVETTMKRRAYENVRDVVRLHLLPEIGHRKLDRLTRADVQRIYTGKLKSGLSAARVHCIHRTLSAALNDAVRWKYIDHNVCQQVSPPRVEQSEVRPFSKDEAKRFLAAAESDERYHALYVLGLTSGARWGELTGLFWSDLDFTNRTMQIERTISRVNGGMVFDTPKTRGSRRTVRLTVRACEALERHREYQRASGIETSGETLVFTNGKGKPIHNSNFIRRSFKPLLRRAGLPDTNWHAATRHTCTCLLLLDRVDPKSICLQLGWSSVAFMLTNYARFLPEWGDGGAMDRILS